MRVEHELLDLIQINSRLCAVRLNSLVCVNSNRLKRRYLVVVSVNTFTDRGSSEAKDEFYKELSRLVLSVHCATVVGVADFNAQLGCLAKTGRHFGGSYPVPAERTDNGDRIIQVCSHHRLLLTNTNFCHEEQHQLTRHPPLSSKR